MQKKAAKIMICFRMLENVSGSLFEKNENIRLDADGSIQACEVRGRLCSRVRKADTCAVTENRKKKTAFL